MLICSNLIAIRGLFSRYVLIFSISLREQQQMKVLNCYIIEISVEICKLYYFFFLLFLVFSPIYGFFFEIFDGVAIKQNNNNNNSLGWKLKS